MQAASWGTMRSTASGGLAVLLFSGLLGAVGCGSDDDSAGTAGTGQSGAAGASGVSAGAAGKAAGEDLAAGEGGALAAGAGGMSDVAASFPCAGPSITSSGEAGEGGAAGQTGQGDQTRPAVSCVVGQSFCYVFAGRSVNPAGGTVYVPECRSFSDFATECSTNATCDCFCSWFHCETECRCKESSGIATVTCEQI